MINCIALINNIKRSEVAYALYRRHSNYHHALHIFHANKKVYDCLNKVIEVNHSNEEFFIKIYNYLFHLEDWFLQFSILEKNVINIEDDFSFPSLKNSIPYPSDFLENIEK